MKKTILLLTDFYYQAKGREYFREDVELSGLLRKHFKVCISHIEDAERILLHVDAILLRNTGPQATHAEQLSALRKKSGLRLFNDLAGKGDIQGKQHLLDLFHAGFPVIPTFRSLKEVGKQDSVERCLLKPLNGADSAGVKIVHRKELEKEDISGVLIQPLIPFLYEVSFYFIGRQFQYALYAPNPEKRWELKLYQPSAEDLHFAMRFIEWNTCRFGIQRVDACRAPDGKLLLMELEDYNPFLSLDLLPMEVKRNFVEGLCASLSELISNGMEIK